MKKRFLYTLIFIGLFQSATAQIVYDSFNETRVINGQSTEITDQGILKFLIQHRFGRLKDGLDEFFGLDQASIRLGLDYGICDKFMIGIGRSSYNKTVDGYLKYRVFQQKTSFPLSIAIHAGATYDDQMKSTSERDIKPSYRLSYISQVLISSKINSRLSLQIQPVYIHKNLVATPEDDNDIFALGAATRIKLSKIYSLNFEYFYNFSETSFVTYNPFSVSFEVETKGHFFSFVYSNSLGMTEDSFITETTDTWGNGEIHLGFNITRVFNVNHHR